MLEIGTSGTVRGGDGNIPTYSAVEASQLVETFGKRRRLGEVGEIAEEPQLAGAEGILQFPQEQSAEQPRQHAHRQEESWAASDPAGAVEREAAAWHHAMDVRMMLQGLAPGVEHHGHAELGAEIPGIGRDGGKRLGRGAEQDCIDGGLVLERDRTDRCRQGEDDVEVRHRQQLGLPGREPLQTRQPLTLCAFR